MLGELARLEHRFDDAVGHIARAAETSGRLGFLQTEAYQMTSLGRAQCQAGDYEAGAATLALGDRARPRRPATCGSPRSAASTSGGCCARSAGPPRRARRWSGRRVPPRRGRRRAGRARRLPARGARRATAAGRARLEALLDAARRDGDAPVEVFALDALGAPRATTGASASRRRRMDARRTSSPSATGPTAALVHHDERREPRADDDRDPGACRPLIDLAEQQERPHHGERRLQLLGDPDRPDLDRLLRVHEQPLRRDAAREGQDRVNIQPVALIPNTSPWASAIGSTATAAIGQIVAMNVVTSISRRKYLVDVT